MADEAGKDIQMDATHVYREETYTDLKTGSLRKMVPVTAEGELDPTRDPIYTAVAQVMTPGGVLPLSSEIPGAKTMAEAMAGFPAAIKKALADLRTEMETMQRERASQIVVPGRNETPPDLLAR
ncbi:MAG: hypothetical protein PHO14_10785 [Kiritimatiellae bacterium]|jgi:uncharacterized protein involved in propanediol utilization|nr:hypothetical protein [Kiritimatiellia bacterium]MDD4342698.1 hypothetical protein [Kiritimatiellia bacterium]MDY0148451.1 hypothetical protein [Kiritimatiellia bacterium]